MGWVDRQLISVDWDARNLRVVCFTLRSQGGMRIKKVVSVAIPAETAMGDPGSCGALLRRVLEQADIGANRMVVDVPRDQAVLNTLRLPGVPMDDLPAMVEFQIAKELPFPLATAVTDFATTETPDETGTREVLVAAVRREVLDYYQQTAVAAGLKLERVGLRPYANQVAVNELLGGIRHERVLFVDVGPVLTEIDVLRDGKLVFSRAASVTVPRPTEVTAPPLSRREGATLELNVDFAVPPRETAVPERERVVQGLVREVALTMEAYRAADRGGEMDYVVVGGDTGVEDDLLEAIRTRLSINGERYNPMACFGWDAASGVAAGGFAAALGLALGHAGEGRLQFDFLHPKKSIPESQRRLRKAPLAAAVLVLFVTAAAVAYVRTVAPQKRLVAVKQDQIKRADATLKDLKKFREMMTEMGEFERTQIVWVDELRDVLEAWPGHEQIVLSQIDLEQKEAKLELKMDCRDGAILDEMAVRVDDHKSPETGQARFDATPGGRSETKDPEYPVRASMTIELINRQGPR